MNAHVPLASAFIAPKTKRVKIQSPPRSPELDSAYPTGPFEVNPLSSGAVQNYRSHSPPFLTRLDGDDRDSDGADSDPFEREQSQSSEDETVTSSVIALPPASAPSPHDTMTNSLSKILQSRGDPKNTGVGQQAMSVSEKTPHKRLGARTTMDVDAFTSLLMTGSVSPSTASAGPPVKPHFGLQADSSSSTDTSSISQQSLFETLQEPHGETPRTSYELSISEDDDHSTLIGESRKGDNSRPPLPKHRRGKAMPNSPSKDRQSPKGPETVAFEDFKPSFSPTGSRSPTMPKITRTLSDLNKPLPPPPQNSLIDARINSEAQLSITPPAKTSASPVAAEPTFAPKKAPPAVPLTRRHSQMQRSNQPPSRSRSSTFASASSQADENPKSSSPSPFENTPIKMAPPPPPARRSGTSNASTLTPLTSTPPLDLRAASLYRTPSAKSASFLTQSRSRSSSQLSHSSVSGTGLSLISPPPVPPPRRTLSKSSQDAPPQLRGVPISPRTSGEYSRRSAEFDRRASSSSFQYNDAIAETEEGDRAGSVARQPVVYEQVPQPQQFEVETEQQALGRGMAGSGDGEKARATAKAPDAESHHSSSQDILADMEAFQREIDALREQYGYDGGGGGG